MPHLPLDTAPFVAARDRYVWRSNLHLGFEPLVAAGGIVISALLNTYFFESIGLRLLLVVACMAVAALACARWSRSFCHDHVLLTEMRRLKLLPALALLFDCKWALLGLPCVLLAMKLA